MSTPVDQILQLKRGTNGTLVGVKNAQMDAGPTVYVPRGDGCVISVSVIIVLRSVERKKMMSLIRRSIFGNITSSHNTVFRVLLLIIPIKVIASL